MLLSLLGNFAFLCCRWPANFKSAAFESVSKKQSQILSPPEIYAEIAHLGGEKSKYDWYKLVMLAFLAGCYLSFGYSTALLVSGTMKEAPSNPDKDELSLLGTMEEGTLTQAKTGEWLHCILDRTSVCELCVVALLLKGFFFHALQAFYPGKKPLLAVRLCALRKGPDPSPNFPSRRSSCRV
eukprot:1160854-Pelagomonas_calceolata.AAC.5